MQAQRQRPNPLETPSAQQQGSEAVAQQPQDEQEEQLAAPPTAFPLDEFESLRRREEERVMTSVEYGTAAAERAPLSNEASYEAPPVNLASVGAQEPLPRPSIDSHTLPPEYTESHIHTPSHQQPSSNTHARLSTTGSENEDGLDLPLYREKEHPSSPPLSSFGEKGPLSPSPYENLPDSPRSIRRAHQPRPLNLMSAATPRSAPALTSEKMRRELDAVTDAIDRMYEMGPQLVDQRYEPRAGPSRTRSSTLSETLAKKEAAERVREGLVPQKSPTAFRFGKASLILEERKAKGKGKESSGVKTENQLSAENERELMKLWGQIERAHGHRMNGQQYEVDEVAQAEKDIQKRKAFLYNLLDSSSSGRLQNQDASQAAPTERALQDLITMKEFVMDPKAYAVASPTTAAAPSPTRSLFAEGVSRGLKKTRSMDLMNRQRSSSLPVNKYTLLSSTLRGQAGSACGDVPMPTSAGLNRSTSTLNNRSLPPTPTTANTIFESDSVEELQEEGGGDSSSSSAGAGGGGAPRSPVPPIGQRPVSRASNSSRMSSGGGGEEKTHARRGSGMLKRFLGGRRGSNASVLSETQPEAAGPEMLQKRGTGVLY